ncbi:hypothetical protein SETIT_4G076700v2 [Setaria italica]|uniref:Uncharacterized protein n=2 Tax=Setaria italica TaxID=4555 RepID=A0A368QRU7_SETIT|nr:hypothetical protein SETIT_4G076700v2 [Setaria italica]
MDADHIPTIVLAMGAAAVGGPDTLRFLLAIAGKSLAVDVAICVFAIAAAVTPVLGTMLFARYFRGVGVARDDASAITALGVELFQKMVHMVAVAVAFVVAACLLAAPCGSSDLGPSHRACSA